MKPLTYVVDDAARGRVAPQALADLERINARIDRENPHAFGDELYCAALVLKATANALKINDTQLLQFVERVCHEVEEAQVLFEETQEAAAQGAAA